MRAHSVSNVSLFFCLVVSLACAGCGGGGSDTPTAPATTTSTSTQTTTTTTTPSTTGTISGTVSIPANTNAKLFDAPAPLYVRLMMASPAYAAPVTDLTKLTVKAGTATTNPDSNGTYSLSVPAAANIELVVMVPSGNVILQAIVPEVKAGSIATQSVDTTTTAVALIYQQNKSISLSQIQSSSSVTTVKNTLEATLTDANEDSILTNSTVTSTVTDAVTAITQNITPPAAPTNVKTTTGNGQISLSWDTASNATSYTVYMASQAGVKISNYSSLADSMKHSSVTSPYVHTGLTNGKTYYFVVTASNAAGESQESQEVSATPAEAIPTVTGVTAASQSDNTIRVTWSPVTYSALAGYVVYRAEDINGTPATFACAGETSSGVTFFDDSGGTCSTAKEKKEALITGKSYWYQVAVKNSKGEIGGYSVVDEKGKTNMATVGAKAKPGAPAVNTPKPGGGKATLTWTPPATRTDSSALSSSEISGYWVYYGTNSSSFTVNSRTFFAHTVGSTQIAAAVTNLTNNTLYYFVVTTVDTDQQESAFSSVVSATPVAAPAPMAPAWTKACAAVIVNTSTGEVDDPNCSLVPTSSEVNVKWNGVTFHKDGTCYKGATGCSSTPWEDTLSAYNVYRAESSTFTADRTKYILRNVFTTVPGPSGLVILSDGTVTSGKSYLYYVRAVNDEGTESELPADNTDILGPVTPMETQAGTWDIVDIPPPTPAGVNATAGIEKITLSWNAVDTGVENDLDGYYVYMSSSSFNPQTGFTKMTGQILPPGAIGYIQAGLTNGVTYYFYVTAVDKAGGAYGVALESQPSTVVAGIPQAPTPPAAPQWTTGVSPDPQPIVPAAGSITLNWKTVTTDVNGGAINNNEAPMWKYKVYRYSSTDYSTGANGEYLLLAEVLMPTATYTDATANNIATYYFYRVEAVLSDGTAGPQSEYRYGMPQQAFLPRLKNAFLAFVTRITKYISG